MFPDFLHLPSAEVAPRLLGCEFVRELEGKTLRVRIVETESYDQADAASHSYRGETPRNSVMFGESGHLYVYFTYGMHYCSNVVTGAPGHGSGVLIRAVEPVGCADVLEERRQKYGVDITNGPAKLCLALSIDRALNGHDLRTSPYRLEMKPPIPADNIITTTRVGISQAADEPLRFYIKDNAYVSRT